MIKKLKYFLFLLLFVLFGFGFSFGFNLYEDMYVRQNGVVGFSPYSSAYDVAGLSKGGLFTNSLGVGKNLFYLSDGVYFAWVYHPIFGLVVPYISAHSGSAYVQGVPLKYAICDSFSGQYIGDYTLQNCTINNFSVLSLDGITNILSSITSDDYFAFKFRFVDYVNSVDSVGLLYCMSSNSFGKSICFGIGDKNYTNTIYPGLSTKGNFTGDLDYPTEWDLITRDILSNSPAYVSGYSQGSTQGIINNQITGDYSYYDCTWKDIIIALESEGYNNYVCYGGLDNFELYDSTINYNPIPGTGLSISQIWSNSTSRAWDNFTEFFLFWNGLYKDDSNNYNAMRESYPAVYYTYFQLYNQYKGSTLDPRTLLEYCNIKTFDNSTLNNSAGGYFKSACETVVREKQTGLWQARLDGSIYSGGVYTGDTPISVNWSGVGNMSGLETQSDGLSFIQNYFNLIKNKLPTNFSDGGFISPAVGLLGVIPNYIIVFLLAIILFKFLSK